MTVIPIGSDTDWHKLRARHIGSSDIACLFDASPYKTRWMLWHEKRGYGSDLKGSERMNWGKRLEGAIAQGAAQEMSWSIEPAAKDYYEHDRQPVLGATCDYRIVDHERGPGIVEVKNVDYFEYKDLWTETNAPDHIELQVQHQLACTGWTWGAIAVLVGGNRLVMYERSRIPRVITEIERRAVVFWQSVDQGQPPDPYGTATELELLKELFPRETMGKVIELEDETLDNAAAQYVLACEQEAGGKRVRERYRSVLLHACGDAALMKLPSHYVKRTTSKTGAITLKVSPKGPAIARHLTMMDAG